MDKVTNVAVQFSNTASKCEHCGKQYVEKDYNAGKFGIKKISAPDCGCISRIEEEKQAKQEAEKKQAFIKNIYGKSDIGPKFMKCTFENWVRRPELENPFKAARKFATEFKRPSGLYLVGTTRTGKTHLVAASSHKLIEQGKVVIFWNENELLDKVNYKDHDHPLYITNILKHIKMADVVVLNDIGKKAYNETRESTLFSVIDTIDNWDVALMATMNPEASKKLDETETLRTVKARIEEMCWGNMYDIQAQSYYELKR